MVSMTGHSGSCCGINIIYGFSYNKPTLEGLKSLDQCIAQRKPVREKGLLEVVLTDGQVTHWHEELLKRGFVRVSRFYNSGNSVCNVYHLIHGQENMIGDVTDPVNKIAQKKKEVATPLKAEASPFAKSSEAPFAQQAPEPPRPRRQGANINGTFNNATPRAIRTANERGVDLRTVRGTGPGGRIMGRDIPNI